jgi:hypothetical protein
MAYRGWGPDETGKKYERLFVIEYDGIDKHGAYLWRCVCDCGTEVSVRGATLRNGISKSCGCLKNELASARQKEIVGDKNPRWKGGRSLTGQGYVLIKNRFHPAANNNGYVTEHRIVMESIVGRCLYPEETVHHKNGVKNDNRPENLELWSRDHGYGVKVEDKIKQAIETLQRYSPENLITSLRKGAA